MEFSGLPGRVASFEDQHNFVAADHPHNLISVFDCFGHLGLHGRRAEGRQQHVLIRASTVGRLFHDHYDFTRIGP